FMTTSVTAATTPHRSRRDAVEQLVQSAADIVAAATQPQRLILTLDGETVATVALIAGDGGLDRATSLDHLSLIRTGLLADAEAVHP
ncbi:MAG: hypothetical protein ACRD0P_37305, partial [Stackebrandtia sp.]